MCDRAQRPAALATKLEEHEAKQARERLATSTGGSDPQPTQKIAEADTGEARQKAAQQVGTNRQYVSDAKRGASSAEIPPLHGIVFEQRGACTSARGAKMRKWVPKKR